MSEEDERFMALALEDARRSSGWGDVPIGAVVVARGQVVGSAGNERELRQDPTAHAEVLALRAAAARIGRWHLDEATVYVTLEPCAMCAGAMVLARVRRLVFAAPDPKAGFAGSLGNLVQDARLNHRLAVSGGVLEEDAATLLRGFFARRRRQAPVDPPAGP